MPSTSSHTVVLPDGTPVTYHLRSLCPSSSIANSSDNHEVNQKTQEHQNDDISKWTEFCASAFSYKLDPPAPSYFERHFYNDPRGDAALVRVLVVHRCHHDDNDDANTFDEIVSSVRIFRRTLSIPGQIPMRYMEAGGIGEVCTSIEHRRRGLSSILLKDAIQIMNSLSSSSQEMDQRMSCSLLHASPDFRPVYSKVGGYESVRSEWSVVPIRWKSLLLESLSAEEGGGDCPYIVRQAEFPNDARQLQKLHREYSEKRLITIVRSEEYWNNYVSAELGDTLWVLSVKLPKFTAVDAQPSGITTTASKPDHEKDTIVAWLSLRKRGDRFQLREFGVDKKCSINNNTTTATTLAMKFLLRVALDQAGVSSFADKGDVVSLLLPSFVLSEMNDEMTRRNSVDNRNETRVLSFLDFDHYSNEPDDGWMYIHMDHSQPSVKELTTRDTDPIQHFIWPTDSF